MSQWITIIGSLLGVAVGGGLAWLNSRYQFLRQDERDRKRFILSKLEELHELISEYRQAYNSATADRFATATGADSWYAKDGRPLPIEKLRMLVGFYAEDLTSYLGDLEKAGLDVGMMAMQCAKIHRESENTKEQLIKALFSKQQELNSACEKMQKQVVSLSKKYL